MEKCLLHRSLEVRRPRIIKPERHSSIETDQTETTLYDLPTDTPSNKKKKLEPNIPDGINDLGIEPFTPTLTTPLPNCFRISSWNIRNFRLDDFATLISDTSAELIFLCETWARPSTSAPCPGFIVWSPLATLSEGRSRGGSGFGLWCKAGVESRVKILSVAPGLGCWILLDNFHLVGCFYAPPSMTTDQFIKLIDIPDVIYSDIVILGDLNCRLGSLTNDSVINLRGKALLNWMDEHSISLIEGNVRPTFYTSGKSVIDIALCKNIEASLLTLEDPLGSDHVPILVQFNSSKVISTESMPSHRLPKWRIHKLSDPAVCAEFDILLQELNTQLLLSMQNLNIWNQTEIDSIDNLISSSICSIATQVLGVSDGFRVTKLSSPELEVLLRKRKQYWRFGIMDKYNLINKEIDTERKRLITLHYRKFCHDLCKKSVTEQTKLIHSLKKKHSRGHSALKGDQESLEGYGQYFASMFARRPFQVEKAEEYHPVPHQEACPFNEMDISIAISALPKGKAPGGSFLKGEFIRQVMAPSIYRFFQIIWQTGLIPKSWSYACIVPIPKKGDVSLIQNYRPISLTETLRKLFERVILPYLSAAIEPLHVFQGGFRKKRGTLDQVSALQETITSFKAEHKRPGNLCFLDIKAAYDSVDRNILYSKLLKRGLEPSLLNLIYSLFEKNTSSVILGNHQSRAFRNEVGLLQGSILSPLLYSFFINDLAESLEHKACTTLNGEPMVAFLYADDIALFTDSTAHLRELLAICEKHSIDNNYRFAPQKCEAILPTTLITNLLLYENPITITERFIYLGIPFTVHGIDWKSHTLRLCERTRKMANLFIKTGFNLNGFSISTNRILLRTFLRPMLEYGVALMPHFKSYIQPLEQTFAFMIRIMLSLPKSTSSAFLLTFIGMPSCRQRHLELAARWALRMRTLDEDFLVFHALNYRLKVNRFPRNTCFGHCCKRIQSRHESNCLLAKFDELSAADSSVHSSTVWKNVREAGRLTEQQSIFETDSSSSLKTISLNINSVKRIYSLEKNILDLDEKRIIIKWMGRGLFGKPRSCMNCPTSEHSAKELHVQQCTGLNVDAELRRMAWKRAVHMIVNILRACSPWLVD